MGIILKPFALLLLFFYNLFDNYGIALILFAVVIKTILFPVTLKSKKSMIQTAALSDKLNRLQKQYGKDKERYNLEVQKLYEREKVNPMGGCLWSLIPMIVLIALYGIVRQPITYFMDLTVEQIQVIAAQVDWQHVAVENRWVTAAAMEKLVQRVADGEIASVYQNSGFNQIYLISLITPENLSTLASALGDAGSKLFVVNFNFLGLNLNSIPNWQVWKDLSWNGIGLFLLAVLSAVVSWLSMKVSTITNQMTTNQPENKQADTSNKMMMILMPLMSLWIGFSFPAALCVYWIAQYIVSMVQEVIASKMLKKDYEKARIAAEQREQEEKEEEKRRREKARAERQRRIEEEKANKGKKKKKNDDPSMAGVNREDSREGIRAYARGHAYIPDRYGGVQPYADPDELERKKQKAAEDREKEKEESRSRKKNKEPKGNRKQEEEPVPALKEGSGEDPKNADLPAGAEEAAAVSEEKKEG